MAGGAEGAVLFYRRTMRQRDNVTDVYKRQAFLREDYETSNAMLMEGIGAPVEVIAYPYGYSSELSEAIFAEMGVYATVTTQPGTNTIIKGLPQCLRQMDRYGITENVTVEQLLELVQTEAE